MPLVIHPSSRCDICLDDYTWEPPEKTPHAIPCGHIFCKECLTSTTPHICPLCRKAYLSDRAKKLHVGQPERTDEEHEISLLQRLSLLWEDNTPQEDIALAMEEVGVWLRTRPEDLHLALRRARRGLGKYEQLKKKRADERMSMRRLEQKLRQREANANYDKDTSKAVEASLLAQIGDLESKLGEARSEVSSLREELSRHTYTTNPLPPPPEPIPLDHLPTFAQAASSSNRLANPGSSSDPFNYRAYFTSDPSALTPGPSTSQRQQLNRTPYNIYSSTAKAEVVGSSTNMTRVIPGAPSTDVVLPPMPYGNMAVSDNFMPPAASQEEAPVRVASPTAMSGPGWYWAAPTPATDGWEVPASEYVRGYSTGLSQGYDGYIQAQRTPVSRRRFHERAYPKNGHAGYGSPAVPSPGLELVVEPEEGLDDMGSLAASLPPADGLGLFEVSRRWPADPEVQQERVQERPQNSSGYGYIDIPASAPPPSTNEPFLAYERPDNSRRYTTPTQASSRALMDRTPRRSREPPVRSALRQPRSRTNSQTSTQNQNAVQSVVSFLDVPDNRNRQSESTLSSARTSLAADSISSWGTASTGGVSLLGLRGFPPPVVLGSSQAPQTPSVAPMPASFLTTRPAVVVDDDEDNYSNTLTERHSRRDEQWQQVYGGPPVQRSRRSNRHPDSRRTSSSIPQRVVSDIPPSQVAGPFGTVDSDSGSSDNALGLLDLSHPPSAPVGPDGLIPISAPTPVVSSQRFLRSFSTSEVSRW